MSRSLKDRLFKGLLLLSLLVGFLMLAVLLVDVLRDGLPYLDWTLLTSPPSSDPEIAGARPAILATIYIGILLLLFVVPIGVGTAVYLEEYADKRRWYNKLLELNIQNLAAVPSIVYGILGLAFFVQQLEGLTGGRSVMAAGITLAILVLPIVIITSAEAIRAVPSSLREAGYGVGATRWEVTRTQVLPYALPGIITGTVLALARAIGEAAPLLLCGAVTGLLPGRDGLLDPSQLQDRFTALPIVIADWARTPREGFDEIAAAAIIVMLVIVLAMNSVAIALRSRYERKRT